MISIVVPTYEMNGEGPAFLRKNLDSLRSQTFTDFEVVITDNSETDVIEEVVNEYKDLLIRYTRNPQGIKKGASQNTNAGIRKAEGELIKFLYQDDYLAHENALQTIVDNFKGQWLITGCNNNPNPYYSGDIHQGNNKLGSPSCLTIKNDHPMLFDEDLRWLLDCDYYKRMHLLYGEPTILEGVHVVIGEGPHQETNLLLETQKKAEVTFMTIKYA